MNCLNLKSGHLQVHSLFQRRNVGNRFTNDLLLSKFRIFSEDIVRAFSIVRLLKRLWDIGETRFFALLGLYRQNPEAFSIVYQRSALCRISHSMEKEFRLEKSLIEERMLLISSYNCSAIKDRLLKLGIKVSVPTIIDRAKHLGCYRGRLKKKVHDREVLTTAIGALIQHDASHHRWSPYAKEKWVLISSLDDFSPKLLFADFFETETSWAHIQATEALLRRYGLPFRYYVDSLRVFRFVRNRDSFWYKTVLKTDEIDPQ